MTPDRKGCERSLEPMKAELQPRRFAAEDAEALTRLLNSAYQDLQDRGLNFTAATQGVQTTLERVSEGACWVIEHEGHIAATLTMSVPPPEDVQALTETARVLGRAWIGQIAVGSELRGRNVARLLFDVACDWARGNDIASVGLDTAVPAEHLAAMYERWGFQRADVVRFAGKTYDSVVMIKDIRDVR